MAQLIQPEYIRCEMCNDPLSESEYFSNFVYCDHCKWEKDNIKFRTSVNPYKRKDLTDPNLIVVEKF